MSGDQDTVQIVVGTKLVVDGGRLKATVKKPVYGGETEIVATFNEDIEDLDTIDFYKWSSSENTIVGSNFFEFPDQQQSMVKQRFRAPLKAQDGTPITGQLTVTVGMGEGNTEFDYLYFDDITGKIVQNDSVLNQTVTRAEVDELGKNEEDTVRLGSGPTLENIAALKATSPDGNEFDPDDWGIGPNNSNNLRLAELTAQQRLRYWRNSNQTWKLTTFVRDQNPILSSDEIVFVDGEPFTIHNIQTRAGNGQIQLKLVRWKDWGIDPSNASAIETSTIIQRSSGQSSTRTVSSGGGSTGGGETVSTWDNLGGKPFSTITDQLEASDDSLGIAENAVGGREIDDTAEAILGTLTVEQTLQIPTKGEGSTQYLGDADFQIGDGLIKDTSTDPDTLKVDGSTVGGGEWGEITGTLSNQTDLQDALDGKLDASAYAPESDTHDRYTDSEAKTAVTASDVGLGSVENIALSSAGWTDLGIAKTDVDHSDLTGITSDAHHTRYTDSEAKSAVTASDIGLGNVPNVNPKTGIQNIELDNQEMDDTWVGGQQGGQLGYDASVGLFLHYGSAGSGISKGVTQVLDATNTVTGSNVNVTDQGIDTRPKISLVDSPSFGGLNVNGNISLPSNNWIGISGGTQIEFESGGIEIQGTQALSFGNGPPASGIDMNNTPIINVNSITMNGTVDLQSNGNVDSVNNLNVSTIDSNNGSNHINVNQPMRFDGAGGNNEFYELRVDGKGLYVTGDADFSDANSLIIPVV